MATARKELQLQKTSKLHNGDRLNQKEFHLIYETMPDDFKAELIGGIVYVSMPLGRPHARGSVQLGAILAAYEGSTPGVEVCDNATTILGKNDEVQPDLLLRISPACGGQSGDSYDNYITGAPEMVAEVAHSSRAIDLHKKRKRYTKAGVLEYIILCLQPMSVNWFSLQSGLEIAADSDGILKSVVFPGLWIQENALLEMNYKQSMKVLESGMSTNEHLAFANKLARRRK